MIYVAYEHWEEKPSRVHYQDLKPYAVADSLDDLRGPATGTVTLPLAIYWQPGSKTLSLDNHEIYSAYQAVLAEGSEEDVKRFINKERLIELWPDLNLPIHVAKIWEKQFPELRGNMKASW